MKNSFHLAFKVKDIESTLHFYHTILGCEKGRQTDHWIDFDFFGHQLSAHVSDDIPELDFCGTVDGVQVPIPHFGCVLEKKEFDFLKQRLVSENTDFIVKPQKRYENKEGEQETMFVLDYSGNPLEFKSMVIEDQLFTESTKG